MSLRSKIQALLDKINETTENDDADLTLAIQTLLNRYTIDQAYTITENGTVNTPNGIRYNPITINANTSIDQAVTINTNGVINTPNGTRYDPITVDVPVPVTEAHTVVSNGVLHTPSGKRYDPITINVPGPTDTPLRITTNSTVNTPNGIRYDPIIINVPSSSELRLQDKTVTSNGTITADPGYDGLGTVIVNIVGGFVQNVTQTGDTVEIVDCAAAQEGDTVII